MNIVVVGCGRIGAELAYRLFQKGHKVTVVDHIQNAFANLPDEFLGRTVDGEALNQDVLRRAGIEQADGFAAVTDSDSLNAVISHVARQVFHVPNVITRNFDPIYRPLHDAFGHQVICSSSWGAQRMEELLYHGELRTVFSAGNGEVEIYEFNILGEWAGRKLGELVSVEECCPVSLTRAGKAILPDGETLLQPNDIILVSATFNGIRALRKRLNQVKEG